MEEPFLQRSFFQIIPLWPYALLRMFIGAMWFYESSRGVPWDLPALIIGIFLLAGILTPISGLAGLILTVFIYNNRHSPIAWGEWQWIYWVVMLLQVTLIVTRAGRRWGADAIAAKNYPDVPIW